MTKITINGTEYVLRFDMSVAEWMEERFGDMGKAMSAMSGREQRTAAGEIFTQMVNAARDYKGQPLYEGQVTLFDRHAPLSRVRKVMAAIRGAIEDGNRLEYQDEADDAVRDDYLDELRKIENAKN
jgi:hypothetical protein